MAHFAELDSNNVVLRVLVVSNDDITDVNGQEQEHLGIEFLQRLFGQETRWVQTNYKGGSRGGYAGPGMTYDAQTDVFISASTPELERARDPETGRFLADNPATPENEAWVEVSADTKYEAIETIG